MLTSSKQHKASKPAVVDLRAILAAEPDPNIPGKLIEANRRRLRNKLESIEQEILEYENIVGRGFNSIDINSIGDLLEVPIKCRLAQHESVKSFAQHVGVSQRQILRYEEEGYRNCSIQTLTKILE